MLDHHGHDPRQLLELVTRRRPEPDSQNACTSAPFRAALTTSSTLNSATDRDPSPSCLGALGPWRTTLRTFRRLLARLLARRLRRVLRALAAILDSRRQLLVSRSNRHNTSITTSHGPPRRSPQTDAAPHPAECSLATPGRTPAHDRFKLDANERRASSPPAPSRVSLAPAAPFGSGLCQFSFGVRRYLDPQAISAVPEVTSICRAVPRGSCCNTGLASRRQSRLAA
jgi:hypothetical protein